MTTPTVHREAAPPDADALSFAESVRLVARREVVERAREKSFLVSTGVTMLILLVVILLPQFLGFGDPPTYRVAVAPGAPAVADAAREAAERFGVDLELVPDDAVPADAAAAREALTAGELDAYLTPDRIVVEDELDPDLGLVLQGASSEVRAVAQLEAAGIDPRAVEQAQAVPPLPVDALDPPDPEADAREGIVFVGTFILYGQLVGYGFWVATGIVEEKSSRVVELLLATVRPRALLAGKVLGIGLLALAQLVVVAVVGVAGAAAADVLEVSADALEPVLILFGWFLLGFAFYASMFAAAAARVSRQEDLQSVTTPATLLVFGSFLAAIYVGNEPDSAAARVLSIVPPFSALVSPVLTVRGDLAVGELLLAVVLMLAAVAALVVVAARIYEGSVLRMGATVSTREAWRSRRALR